MPLKIPRRSAEVSELIELLDLKLQGFTSEKGIDISRAWSSLRESELRTIAREIARCESSLRYFLENYFIIQTGEGPSAVRDMWDSQLMFLEAIEEDYDLRREIALLLLKSRQLGISRITSGTTLHKTIFTPETGTFVLAYDPKTADYVFDIYRFAFDHLPWWMRPECRYEAKGRYMVFGRKDSQERMVDPGLNSHIVVGSAQKKEGLEGTGFTIRVLHCTELWGFPDASSLTKGIFPTMHAKDKMRIIESTAYGRGNFFYDWWVKAIEGESEWKTLFIPPYARKDYSIPLEAGEKIELDEEERGIREQAEREDHPCPTDGFFKWRRAKIDETIEMEGDDISFQQNYPCTWEQAFLLSGTCAFPKPAIMRMIVQAIPPNLVGEISLGPDLHRPEVSLRPPRKDELKREPEPGGRLWVWEQPQAESVYYISADIAYGGGGDYSCGEVLKLGRPTGDDVQVAEWWGWESPHTFAYILAAMGFWYNEAELAPEINDFGSDIANTLFREIAYPNVFVWKHYDKRINAMTDFLGWKTTAHNKGMLVSRMRDALLEASLVLRSRQLLDQMLDYQQWTSGDNRTSFGGASGNDDMVSAIIIGNFCAHDADMAVAPEQGMGQRETGRSIVNTDYAPAFGEVIRRGSSRISARMGELSDLKEREQWLRDMKKGGPVRRGSPAASWLEELHLHTRLAQSIPAERLGRSGEDGETEEGWPEWM